MKNMPAKSKAQARFMRGVASGKIKRKGLSRSEAGGFVEGHGMKGLPERISMSAHRREMRKRFKRG